MNHAPSRFPLAILMCAVCIGVGPGVSLAQPSPDPAAAPPTSPPDDAATPDDASGPAPDLSPERPAQAPVVSAAAGDEDDELRLLYKQAYAHLLAGRFEAAGAAFSAVAARATDPGLQAAAGELGRLAETLAVQGVRFVRTRSPSEGSLAEEDRTAGRTSFVISTTTASLYAGVVLIDLLDQGGDFRPVVGILLGTTAAGFLGSYYGSRHMAIAQSTSDAYSLGISLGVGNGLLLSLGLLDDVDDNETELVQGTTLAAMAAAGAGGLLLAHSSRPTRGQVTFTSLTSTLGISTVGLGLLVLQPDIDGDTILLALAGGLDAGALAGVAFAPQLQWSLARARLTGLGTFLGALTGWGVAALASGVNVDDSDSVARAWGASTMAGMWGGFALTAYLTRNMAPDRRFLDDSETSALVTPLMVPGGVGLGLSGRF
ncbi:hypothetical protein [Haliangium sp.]|uniref:hypothetical protein n=1 Tax=Haliangium sp. TaxID=2663208 RepID=UPI003D0A5BD2